MLNPTVTLMAKLEEMRIGANTGTLDVAEAVQLLTTTDPYHMFYEVAQLILPFRKACGILDNLEGMNSQTRRDILYTQCKAVINHLFELIWAGLTVLPDGSQVADFAMKVGGELYQARQVIRENLDHLREERNENQVLRHEGHQMKLLVAELEAKVAALQEPYSPEPDPS